MQTIDPKRIRTDLGTQARVQTDVSVIEEYAAAMLRGDRFPSILVFHDLASDLLVLVDGFHRLHAHLKAKPDEEINAIIQEGTLSDALWASFTVNKTHGLRRNTADKRRIIAEALRHEKGVKMSDRQIAEHIGVDNKTVASVRRELEGGEEIPHLECRTGKDGKSYEVKSTANREKTEVPDNDVLIALPKFPDNRPEALGKILLDFFSREYITSLVSVLNEKNKERRLHAG